METSSILSTITKIREQNSCTSHNKDYLSVLHDYEVHYDHVMRTVAIEAELRACCLDAGSDLKDYARNKVAREGMFPGDRAVQIIHKRLGGPEHAFNAVPWNAKVDLGSWEDSTEVIYNHLKDPNATARLLYALEYDNESEDEFLRPTKVFYHFTLYDGDKGLVGNPIEGIINNPLPFNE